MRRARDTTPEPWELWWLLFLPRPSFPPLVVVAPWFRGHGWCCHCAVVVVIVVVAGVVRGGGVVVVDVVAAATGRRRRHRLQSVRGERRVWQH